MSKVQLIFIGSFTFFYQLGHFLRKTDNKEGVSIGKTIRTPIMFGNNGRASLFPYKLCPYNSDFEKLL